MKIFKTLLVVFLLLFSAKSFAQSSDKDILSYSYVKDEKGNPLTVKFGAFTTQTMIGNDDKYVYMKSGSYMVGSKTTYYVFDKNTLQQVNKVDKLVPYKNYPTATITQLYLFRNRLFVLSVVSDKGTSKSTYLLQEINRETFEYIGTPVKIYDGIMETPSQAEMKTSTGEFNYMTINSVRFFMQKSEDENKMFFFFFPFKKKDVAEQKITVVTVDQNGRLADNSEFTINEVSGKYINIDGAFINSKSRLFLNTSWRDTLSSNRATYKYFVFDLLHPDFVKENPINKNSFSYWPGYAFMVDDSLAYDIHSMGKYEKQKKGTGEDYNESGLYMCIISLNSGDIVAETTFQLEPQDLADMKGSDKATKEYIMHYPSYNKFTGRFYMIYVPMAELVKNQVVTSEAGNIKIKEFDMKMDVTKSLTIKSGGDGGVYPFCTPEGTYMFANSKKATDEYGNEPEFKISDSKSDYYVIKLKDEKLTGYGYAIKESGKFSESYLGATAVDISDNEKVLLLNKATAGGNEVNFVRVKFR